MRLVQALDIRSGVIAVIGGGGKTTLIAGLALELLSWGSVLVCATAKMYPPAGMRTLLSPTEEELAFALQANSLLCVGDPTPEGKLTYPREKIPMLAAHADFVLCEADGSKGLPLKAHGANEPVIPKEAAKTILVIGIDGIGKPIIQGAHRPELYAQTLGTGLYHIVTARDAAQVALLENLHDVVFINKVETPEQLHTARALAGYLRCPAAAGALQKGGDICLL